eukprot:gb/GECG01006015.1/.p1 GENE.gb/GECG01006015.1/~~gb/GECG01006015.1/.p1  ORF type:complete len:122 (+),score=26.35 gb/GECG01006015.1/:1-366(+)
MSNSNSELDEAIESFVQSDQTVKKEQQLQQSSVHDNEDGDLPFSEESSAAVERRQAFEKVVELIPTRVSIQAFHSMTFLEAIVMMYDFPLAGVVRYSALSHARILDTQRRANETKLHGALK